MAGSIELPPKAGFPNIEGIAKLPMENDPVVCMNFRLEDFIASFEQRYEGALKNWFGRMDFLEPALIIKNLYDALSYTNNLPFIVSSKKPKIGKLTGQ